MLWELQFEKHKLGHLACRGLNLGPPLSTCPLPSGSMSLGFSKRTASREDSPAIGAEKPLKNEMNGEGEVGREGRATS